MRLILEIISGPEAGQKIIVQAGQTVRIGRTSNAGVAVEDTFMSSQHFAIECMGGACGLRDLGSRNGTKLNGEKVTSVVLQNGDRILAGQTEFVVQVESDDPASDQLPPSQLKDTLPPTEILRAASEGKVVAKVQAPSQTVESNLVVESWSKDAAEPSRPPHVVQPFQVPEASAPLKKSVPGALREEKKPQVSAGLEQAILSYEAATPEGTLLRILQNQPEHLMALVDATRDRRVLDLLHNSSEEYRSLYRDDQNLAIAPYVVRLPPSSPVLKQMIHEGWGRGWGVYLTCAGPLHELREYFRQALMVSTPDGVELFSRFYDPRFFRGFLESCSATEAEKFFGPISSYLMEAERPEILLQFTKTPRGAEKKGHLLTRLE